MTTKTKLIKFYSKTCNPCKMVAQQLEQVDITGVDYQNIDVESEPALAAEYGVMSVPTLVIEHDGVLTARHTGFAPAEKIQALLQERE